MIYSFTRIASLVLAFGFFFGCSTLKSGSDVPSGPIPDNATEEQLQKRMVAIQNEIDEQPDNPDLHYQKGLLLTKWAQKKDSPSKRTAFYVEADQELHTADSLFSLSPAAEDTPDRQTDQLRRITWSSEHNQGIQKLQNAQLKDDYWQSAIHFQNATAIMPDSITSYHMASEAFYNGEMTQKAIQMLESARRHIDPPTVELLESLGSLYLETGQPKQAVPLFEKARSLNKRNFNIMHGLSNAYIQAGEHQKAIALLELLEERQPNNRLYQLTLADQLYKAGAKKLTLLLNNTKQNQPFQRQLFSAGNSLFNQAEERYVSMLDQDSGDEEITLMAAQFYQNKAAQYQKLLPYFPQSERKDLESVIDQSVSASIPLLRQLAEQDPSTQIWQNLYQAYRYLGMQEEARKAKANI